MSQNKPKFGARIVRAISAGLSVSFVLFLISYFLSVAINRLAKEIVVDPIALGIFSFALGLAGAIATELSKDLET